MVRILFCFAMISYLVSSVPSGTNPYVIDGAIEQDTKENAAIGLSLIKQQHYDNAIDKLEQILEIKPNDPQALTYLATANLYKDRNFTKSEKSFEQAFKAGGGATFWVSHSHE